MNGSPPGLETDQARRHNFSRHDAAHLLRRTGFGADEAAVRRAVADGMESTVERLLTPQSETDDFRTTASLLRRAAHDLNGIDDLKTWWLYRMRYTANPLVEKMTVFWHNHFATSHAKVRSVQDMATQNELFRHHALGSFRELLHGVSRDVAMLKWLDGNSNRKRHPNENFARELMELFSLGEGNYSEKDLSEAARAFTGWHVRKDRFWFNRIQHDFGSKTVLGTTGNLDGDDVVDLCLQQPACPRFLAGKLLDRFVMPNAPSQTVDALANRVRQHDFVMSRVLRDLFTSKLFFSAAVRHTIIKSPLDLVVGTYRMLGTQSDFRATVSLLAEMGQDIFEPPTVEGWKGGRLWINSATMLQRVNFAAELIAGDKYGRFPKRPAGKGIGIDRLERAETDDWAAPRHLVVDYADLLLGQELDPPTVAKLQEFFAEAGGPPSLRVRKLIHVILTMPEYQLS